MSVVKRGGAQALNTSPQVMLALLRQLVYEAGVDPVDIAIGDPLSMFPNQLHAPLYAEFPTVSYLDSRGSFGRTAVMPSTTGLHWSSQPENVAQDMVLSVFAEASYFINLANLKSHSGAGVTQGIELVMLSKSHSPRRGRRGIAVSVALGWLDGLHLALGQSLLVLEPGHGGAAGVSLDHSRASARSRPSAR
jgi:hypothetical protein